MPNQEEQVKETLFFYNPWWTAGKVPQELFKPYQRPVLKKLISYLGLERVIILKGPRRTGKTTLFYQFIDYLLKKGTNPKNILYLSFDDPKARKSLDTLIQTYEIITKKTIKNQKVYFFLDEIQYLDEWSFYVKKYFDKKFPIKFIVSGSAASLIKKTSESLAGRTIEEILYPFNFFEFTALKYRENKQLQKAIRNFRKNFSLINVPDTTNLIPFKQDINIAFEEYFQRGGFPHIFTVKNRTLWKRLLREDIVEKVIYRDLVELYDIKKPQVLEKLFYYLIDVTSSILNISNIANSLKLSREYTEKYLFYLKSALLCFTIQKFAPSKETQIRSNRKVYMIDHGLVQAFEKIESGKIIENLVALSLLNRKYPIGYSRNRFEIDFIIQKNKTILPLEVKYKERLNKKDTKKILSFMKKYKAKHGIVVTKDLLKQEVEEDLILNFIPIQFFLLGL